jgi:hypothetical protein
MKGLDDEEFDEDEVESSEVFGEPAILASSSWSMPSLPPSELVRGSHVNQAASKNPINVRMVSGDLEWEKKTKLIEVFVTVILKEHCHGEKNEIRTMALRRTKWSVSFVVPSHDRQSPSTECPQSLETQCLRASAA